MAYGIGAALSIVLGAVVALGYGPYVLVAVGGVVVIYGALWAGFHATWISTSAVLLAPTLLGIPQLFPGRSVEAYAAVAGVFALLGTTRLARRPVARRAYAPWVALFFVLVLIACVRSEVWGLLSVWAAFFAFSAAVILTADTEEVGGLRLAIILSPAMYVAANVGLAAVGIGADRTLGVASSAEVLQALGLSGERELFPLAFGFSDFGVTAALGLVGTLMLLRGAATRAQRAGLVFAAALCLYGLLSVDTRGAIVAALLSVLVVVGFARLIGRSLGLIAIAIPVSAAIAAGAVGLVANSQEALQLERSGTDAGTLTGRTYLWEKVGNRLQEFSVDDVWGYGINGTSREGISQEYAVDLPAQTDASQGSAHNFALQTIFDVGYVGLLAAVVVFGFTISRLAVEVRRPASAAMLAMLLFTVLVGATDTMPTIYTPQAFAVWAMIALIVVRAPAVQRPSGHSADLLAETGQR